MLSEDEGPNQLLDDYPLFTYSIWRISAIVNARCNVTVNNIPNKTYSNYLIVGFGFENGLHWHVVL